MVFTTPHSQIQHAENAFQFFYFDNCWTEHTMRRLSKQDRDVLGARLALFLFQNPLHNASAIF